MNEKLPLKKLIPQTNKTILFAEVNNNKKKKNLATMLVKGVTDESIGEIEEELLVKDFDDFLEKFDPTIYSSFNSDKEFCYDLEYGEGKTAYSLKNSEVLDMLTQLLNSKKSSGQKNLDFDYEKLLELITPQNTVKKIKREMAETLYLFEEYEKYPSGDSRRKELGTLLTKKFVANREVYQNYPTLLAIAVDNVKSISKRVDKLGGSETGKPIQIGNPIFTKEGNLEFKKLPLPSDEGDSESVKSLKQPNQLLAEKIGNDYEIQTVKNGFEVQTKVKELLTFGLNQISKNEITKADMEMHDNMLTTLQKEKENFFNAIVPLLQTILGVKSFFDQYSESSNNNNSEAPKLLITNCKASEFASDNAKNLATFLEEINNTPETKDYYWLAIIPDVSIKSIKRKIEKNHNEDNDFGLEAEDGNEEIVDANCDKNNLSIIADVLAKYKIQCFFNFKASRDTSFLKINLDKIKENKDNTKTLESDNKRAEMLVNCIPNFTVIPKGKRYNLGTKLIQENGDGLQKSSEVVTLPGIFIDSSYVACGLVASWQSATFLKERFGNSKTSKEHSGVRVDVEKMDNYEYLYTTFAREGNGYTGSFQDSLALKPYGFIFSSNKIYSNKNLPKERITVLRARTLSKDAKGIYKDLYKILSKNYLARLIKAYAGQYGEQITKDKILEVVGDDSSSYKAHWDDEKKSKFVNSLLQEGDSISFNDENQLIFTFAGKPELLDLEILDK